MGSFNIINIKVEKENAMKKHRQLQKFANLFRFIEICLILALISRFSVGLPVAVKNSAEYFKDITVILLSPRFVFILGNAIVITLFAKSGQFSGQDPSEKNSRTDLYEEFVEKSERNQIMQRYEAGNRGKQSSCVECIVTEATCTSVESKNYQRSRSEKLDRVTINKPCIQLRRSATEKCRGSADSGEGWVKVSYPEDNMSNEEFRCTVEAFIARQKRFRKDEENSIG